jgi:hypothetical protein
VLSTIAGLFLALGAAAGTAGSSALLMTRSSDAGTFEPADHAVSGMWFTLHSVTGDRPFDAVRDALSMRHPSLSRCFDVVLGRLGEHELSLAVGMAPDGSVTKVDVVASDFRRTTVEPCVLDQVRSWRFRRVDDASTIRFTMTVDEEVAQHWSGEPDIEPQLPADRDSLDPAHPPLDPFSGYQWGGLREYPSTPEEAGHGDGGRDDAGKNPTHSP